MKTKLVVALIVAVVLAGSVGRAEQPQAAKLEGAWVARVTSFEGAPVGYVSQWSYVLVPDSSGRSATLHGSIDLKLPQPTPPDVYSSPLIGECVMTGPDTAKCFAMWYHIQRANPLNQLISIGTVNAEITMLRSGNSEVTHHFAIYPPGSDTDGDGIPDSGTPMNAFTVTTRDTRLPQPVAR